MPQLLVTTSSYVLRYCTETRTTFIVESNRPGYYGVSWFSGGSFPFFSHAGYAIGNDPVSSEDYMLSEVGFLSNGDRCSNAFLSVPHQIRCVEDNVIAVANTGRNCLSLVNAQDWSVRQVRFSDVLWDRMGADQSGNHYNSIEYKNGRLFVVAHNFSKGSFTVELEWPSLRVIEISQYQVSSIHNLWVRDDEIWIACDSMRNGLIDLKTERMLWQTDHWSFTRGLAANSRDIYVGSSENAPRHLRQYSETGIWVIDAGTMKTRDYHWLGQFGGVHEVRLIDEFDLCHSVGPITLPPNLLGLLVTDYFRTTRLASAEVSSKFREDWKIELGEVEHVSDGKFLLPAGSLNLATRRYESSGLDVTISACLSIKSRCDAQSAILGGYLGPADQNMVALLLSGLTTGQINLGLWISRGGEWVCTFVRPHALPFANVRLILRRDMISIQLNDQEIFAMANSNSVASRVGVRGMNGEVADFSVSSV